MNQDKTEIKSSLGGPGSLADHPLPMAVKVGQDDEMVCCGGQTPLPSSPDERPGYVICHFVEGFVQTPAGSVPKVATRLDYFDALGTLRARIGFRRNSYAIAPGLYCVGTPDENSAVLVTANYKLTFDHLRVNLSDRNLWVLVLDTRGVNVWCAAGKKNFADHELITRIRASQLDKVVKHRELILPQLGAPGVKAQTVKQVTGFTVKWGPIRAVDLPGYLDKGGIAAPAMREVGFALYDRVVLIPVEIALFIKPSLWILAAFFVLSGINTHIFSLDAALWRGSALALSYFCGILAGAVVVPILLPYLPGRRFFVKGIETGCVSGVILLQFLPGNFDRLEESALFLLCMTVSSWLAMNFTGATPYTSPSGVEKEMRQGIPLQAILGITALGLWLAAPFIG